MTPSYDSEFVMLSDSVTSACDVTSSDSVLGLRTDLLANKSVGT